MFLWKKREPPISPIFSSFVWRTLQKEKGRKLSSSLHLAMSSRFLFSFPLFKFFCSSYSCFYSFLGPCPPCSSMGPLINCYCGDQTTRLRCGTIDTGYSCGDVCNKTLNCGIHECEETCHAGNCKRCPRDQMMVCL